MKRLLLIPLFCVGCASTSQNVQNSLPYLPTATSIASGLIVNLTVTDPEKKKEVYNYMYYWASLFRSLSGGETPDKVRELISLYAPSQSEWADVAIALSSVYASYYPEIKGDTKLGLQVLEALAQGCEKTAEKVIK